VPVAVGTDGGCTLNKDTFSNSAFGYLGGEDEFEADAEAMLKRVLMDEEPQSVVFLCISSLTDCAKFLRENEQLFKEKVHSVTIMGGVELSADEATIFHGNDDGQGGMEDGMAKRRAFKPDTANNNTFDMPSAHFLYQRLQELEIKLSVLTRFAAYGCPLPRGIYDEMQSTGSPIALRLFDVQRKSIEELWKRANAEGEERRGLPPRCSKEWYMNTFLGGKGADRGANDSIWDLVKQFNMYDPMALILAIPPLAWIFFSHGGGVPKGAPTNVRVVGAAQEHPGVCRPQVLREFMMTMLRQGLQQSRCMSPSAKRAGEMGR